MHNNKMHSNFFFGVSLYGYHIYYFAASLSEYSKIPATVTAPDKLDATSRSVFYVGRTESAENRKAKKLKNATSPFFSDKGEKCYPRL